MLAVLLVGGTYGFLLKDYQRERIWSTYNHDRLTRAQRAGPGYQLTQSLAQNNLQLTNGEDGAPQLVLAP